MNDQVKELIEMYDTLKSNTDEMSTKLFRIELINSKRVFIVPGHEITNVLWYLKKQGYGDPNQKEGFSVESIDTFVEIKSEGKTEILPVSTFERI